NLPTFVAISSNRFFMRRLPLGTSRRKWEHRRIREHAEWRARPVAIPMDNKNAREYLRRSIEPRLCRFDLRFQLPGRSAGKLSLARETLETHRAAIREAWFAAADLMAVGYAFACPDLSIMSRECGAAGSSLYLS